MCFVDLKRIWMICKMSKCFEKCRDNLKSVRMIFKVSKLSENYLDDLKSVQMIWKEYCQSTYYKTWNFLATHFSFILGINSKSSARFLPWGDLRLPKEIRDLHWLSQVSNTENACINKIWLRKIRTSTTETIWPTFFHRRYFFESACPVWYVGSSTATLSRVPLIVYVNRIWTRYWKADISGFLDWNTRIKLTSLIFVLFLVHVQPCSFFKER